MDGFLANVIKYLLFATNFAVFVSMNTAAVFGYKNYKTKITGCGLRSFGYWNLCPS